MLAHLAHAVLGKQVPLPPGVPAAALPPGVTLREGRLIPRIGGLLSRLGGPAAAVTLGRTIVVHPRGRLTPTLLAHELEHVRQWREDGLFPVRYALATLRYGYQDNPYEIAARSAALTAANPTPTEDLS